MSLNTIWVNFAAHYRIIESEHLYIESSGEEQSTHTSIFSLWTYLKDWHKASWAEL